jgi:tRNA threonylcarbamoyladenosine biosynthesis protein TsaB
MRPKPLILAIETSGRTGSAAMALGEDNLGEVCFSGPPQDGLRQMRHSAEIFPAVQKLLERFSREPKEIEHIYVSAGPGSFTGLRIAVALAKIMHLANAAKVVAVDTLDVIAANADDYIKEEKAKGIIQIATILDAKRGQFFIAAYQNEQVRTGTAYAGVWKKTLPDCLMTAEQFLENFTGQSQSIWLLGEGLVYHKDKFEADGIRFLNERYWSPRAGKVHLLGWQKALTGQFADPLTLQPTYLRRPDVKEKQQIR